jgi:beta-N-acetylhexosaminidase
VFITDALEMRGAALAAGGIAPAAVRALTAGADLLCVGARVNRELVEAIAGEIVAAVRDGELPLARLEEAFTRTAKMATWSATPARKSDHDEALGVSAARRAVRVEGSPAGLGVPLVVQVAAGHSIAEGRVPWGLRPHLNGVPQVDVVADDASATELIGRADGRPIVVVGRHLHRSPAGRALVEKLAAAYPVVVVEMGWPSAWRPAGLRAFVTTHGASRANGRAAAEVLGLA